METPETGIFSSEEISELSEQTSVLKDFFAKSPRAIVTGTGGRFLLNRCRAFLDPTFKADAFLTLSGREGTGKTSLAIQILRSLEKDFSLRRQLIPNPTYQKVIRKVVELEKGAGIIIDELDKILNKKDWNTRGSRFLLKVFRMMRKKRKLLIGCMPNFWELNSDLRNSRVLLRVHIVYFEKEGKFGRGLGFVHEPFYTDSDSDPWFLPKIAKMNKELADKIKKETITPLQKLRLMYKYPSCRGLIIWNDLPEDLYKEYEEFVEADDPLEELFREVEAEEKGLTPGALYLNRFSLAMKRLIEKGDTSDFLGTYLEMDPGTIDKLMKRFEEKKASTFLERISLKKSGRFNEVISRENDQIIQDLSALKKRDEIIKEKEHGVQLRTDQRGPGDNSGPERDSGGSGPESSGSDSVSPDIFDQLRPKRGRKRIIVGNPFDSD